MTAMASAPAASSARKAEKKLAAASTRSPDALRLIVAPACCGTCGPEGQQRLAVAHLARSEPEPRRGRIVPFQHARRGRLPRLAERQRDRPADDVCDALACETTPSRRITGASPVTSTTVDSSPIGAGPPSRMMATRSAEVCLHVRRERRAHMAGAVGAGRRDRPIGGAQESLGEGMGGNPQRDGVEAGGRQIGHRAPRLPWRITRVRAPGQNAAANCRPLSVRRPSRKAASVSGTCTISGLKCGRPLAAKIAATARPFVASAPRPYTVSVGKATRAPSRKAAAAAGDRLTCCLQDCHRLLPLARSHRTDAGGRRHRATRHFPYLAQ